MARFLITVAFCGMTLIRRTLLEGGAYSYLSINVTLLIRGRRLFEIRHLSEEIRYLEGKQLIFASDNNTNHPIISFTFVDTGIKFKQ